MAIVNDAEVFPSKRNVDTFVYAEVPQPLHGLLEGPGMTLGASALAYQIATSSVATYLLATGMAVEHGGGLRLSKVGRAFETGAERYSRSDTADGGKLEVVGRLEDPVVYARLLTEIDKLPESLVVDPYLPPADLLALLELPSVNRVLTKDASIKGQKQEDRRRHLAIGLGSRPEVELRFLPAEMRELHDRHVLAGSGDEGGLTIGTSLGGSQMTVITHLGVETTQVLRSHYDSLWERALPLEPIARIADRDALTTSPPSD